MAWSETRSNGWVRELWWLDSSGHHNPAPDQNAVAPRHGVERLRTPTVGPEKVDQEALPFSTDS
jgi:hypothetical protein